MYFGIAFFMYVCLSFVVHYFWFVSIVISLCIDVCMYVGISPGRRFVRSFFLYVCLCILVSSFRSFLLY